MYLDQDTRLVVRVGGEGLGLLGWNGSVTLDESSHDTTGSFNTKGQWSNIEKEKILNFFRFVTTEDSG